MKGYYLFFVIFSSQVFLLGGLRTFVGQNGKEYRLILSDSPSTRILNSEDGKKEVVLKTIEIEENMADNKIKDSFVLLSFNNKEALIGRSYYKYAILSNKICACYVFAANLFLRKSVKDSFTDNVETSVIESFIKIYTNDVSFEAWDTISMERIDLRRLFGNNILGTGSLEKVDYYTDDLKIEGNELLAKVNAKAPINRKLTIGLNFAGKVTSAKINERYFPVFYSDPNEFPEVHDWFPFTVQSFKDNQANVPAFVFSRHIEIRDDGKHTMRNSFLRAIVLPSNGNIWLGTIDCNTLLIDGNIIGIAVNSETEEIEIYLSQSNRISLFAGCANELRSELMKYESELKERNGKTVPDIRVNLKTFFSENEVHFGQKRYCSLRFVTVKNGKIIVLLNTDTSKYLKIIMNCHGRELEYSILDMGDAELTQEKSRSPVDEYKTLAGWE